MDRPSPRRYRSIFVSDTHLGSRRSHAGSLLGFLRLAKCDHLYLVGDIADRWGPGGASEWPAEHVEVLSLVRERARNGTTVHYVPGNHDPGLLSWMARELNARVDDELEHVTADGRRVLVLHGDGFDAVVSRLVWLSRVGDGFARGLDWIAGGVERLLPRQRPGSLATRLKQRLKRWMGYTGRFEDSAVRSARARGLHGVICGHIHAPACRVVEGVLYGNDGDWVQSCTALVEHLDGRFELVSWTDLQRDRR